MNRLIPTIVFIATVFSTAACSCEDLAVISMQKDDGTRVGLVVPSESLKKAPKWIPDNGEPPLSISEARTTVLEWAADKFTRYDSVEISEISLRKSGACSGGEYWFYIFDLRPVIEGNSLWGSGNWAAVLMDGTVIGTTELD